MDFFLFMSFLAVSIIVFEITVNQPTWLARLRMPAVILYLGILAQLAVNVLDLRVINEMAVIALLMIALTRGGMAAHEGALMQK